MAVFADPTVHFNEAIYESVRSSCLDIMLPFQSFSSHLGTYSITFMSRLMYKLNRCMPQFILHKSCRRYNDVRHLQNFDVEKLMEIF